MIQLPEFVLLFICTQKGSRVTDINFRFPGIFRRGITFPCSQVQSLAKGALVGEDGFNFILFFIIYDVGRQR